MEKQIVKVLETELVTHNVRRFKLQKPDGVKFIPGQAADISINKESGPAKNVRLLLPASPIGIISSLR